MQAPFGLFFVFFPIFSERDLLSRRFHDPAVFARPPQTEFGQVQGLAFTRHGNGIPLREFSG